MKGPKVDAVIFDLGNVICSFDFERAYRRWAAASALSVDTVRDSLGPDDVFHAFEKGEIDVDTLLPHVAERLGTPLSRDAFVEGWNAIFTGLCEGMDRLVPEVAARTRLVVLSNTNALHADVWRRDYGDVLDHAERVFTSHEIGARKPERASYEAVVRYLDVPAERIAFFDDHEEFVEGGRACGLHAFRVTDLRSIQEPLTRLGVLSRDAG